MIISDLNHLEVISEETSVVGGFDLGYDYSKVDFEEKFNLEKKIYSKVDVKGHVATAESKADAYGYGSVTQIFTSSYTSPYGSSSGGVSISASN